MAQNTYSTRSAQRLAATLLALGVAAVGLGSTLPVDKPGVVAKQQAAKAQANAAAVK